MKTKTEIFIEKARKIHGNLYDYSKVVYINNLTRVTIIDPEYGEFLQFPKNHLKGYGNKLRKASTASIKLRLTKEKFIEKSKLVHGNLYDYSKVEYINNTTKVIIIDPQYGEFKQRPMDHMTGSGNPKRGNKNKTFTKEIFIEKARKVHGNLYDYSKVIYKNCYTSVIIIDPKYGEFEQTPDSHLRGAGNKLRHFNSRKLTKDEFITRSKEIHNNLYDYSKVDYIDVRTQVIIIDPDFGEFLQLPSSHLSGSGNIERGRLTRLSNTEEFIEKSRKIHGDLYDYSKVDYINNTTEVIIIDPLHGEFLQTPKSHLLGHGNNLIYGYTDDHIIPLSIIVSSKERYKNFHKNRPLFKLLNSKRNIQRIDFSQNSSKNDKILVDGEFVSAKKYRNNYNVIKKLLYENMKNIDILEIEEIIKKDKEYIEIGKIQNEL